MTDFLSQASAHGLHYLCEADLHAAVPQNIDPALRRRLTDVTIASRANAEQDLDFLTGRLFRRSILTRQPLAPPAADRLAFLNLSCGLRHDPAQNTPSGVVFSDARGRSVTIANPTIQQAMLRLTSVYPGTAVVDELAEPADRDLVCQAMLKLAMAGRVSLSSVPLQVGRADQIYPAVWRYARFEATTAQPWLSSLAHKGVPVHSTLRTMVPYLDGTRNKSALQILMQAAERRTKIDSPESADPMDLAGVEQLDRLLHHLEAAALLEPSIAGERQ